MTNKFRQYVTLIAVIAVFSILTGCGGTKVLKEPRPVELENVLATSADANIEANLDWVIVRDGPGTWAKNADWDEYLLRVSNHSDRTISILELAVVDSLQTRIESLPGRKQLVKGSKATARRYRDSGVKVKAGRGATTMLVAGTAVTAVGVASASAIGASALASGAATAGSAGAVAGGLVLLGPAIAVGGIARGINNSAVNTEIEQRQTTLPLDVRPGEEAPLDLFFPLAPSPVMVELVYADDSGLRHTVRIDTTTALRGLHFAEMGQET